MFKVLIVDDEPMARDALKMATDWGKYGFFIAGECENGEEALHLSAEIQPDLILTDIKMPDMDGLELAKRVLDEVDRDTIFIIVSGYNEFDYAKKALRLGIRYYLLKPVFEEDISKVLLEVLGELGQREEMKRIDAESYDVTVDMFFERLLSGRLAPEEIRESLPSALQPDGNELWSYAALYLAQGPELAGGDENSPSMMGYDDLKKAVKTLETEDVRMFTVFHDTCLFGVILRNRRGIFGEPWRELIRIIKKLNAEGFFLAVGNPADDLAGLPGSMDEAETALEYRFFYPPGSILLYREIKDRSLNYSYKGIHYMEGFLASLENMDQESISTSITAMFDAFRKSFMAPEVVRMYLINIVYRSLAILSEIGGTSDEISLSNGMDSLLEGAPSLDSLESLMREYTESYRKYAQSLKDRDTFSVIKKVEDYIRDNFRRSLTVKEIARKLFIHPTYLGHQINKWFGCGFNEYLHKMRMKEAVQLISETDMRIHEIAAGLGYATYGSFLEQFEKNFSLKPTEFRSRVRESPGRTGN